MINGRFIKMILSNIGVILSSHSKLKKEMNNPDYDESDYWHTIQYACRKLNRKANVELRIHYDEYRPTGDGCMIYAHHQGLYDPIALISNSLIPLSAVCKIELENTPIIRDIIKATNSLCIDRTSIKQSLKVFNSVAEGVKSGRNYVVFPEGTRSKNTNTLGEFHAASFKCAMKAKCDIYPVAFVNSYKVLDERGFGRVIVDMHYLPCIKYEEYKDMKSTELSELVKSKIQSVIDIYERREGN